MSDLNNITPEGQKINLFGEDYDLKFTFRNYAAIQRKFGKTPVDLIEGVFKFDVESLVLCLWGGTLEFEPFDPADPVKIKEEIELEKLYSVNFSSVFAALKNAMLTSTPETDKDIVEKKTQEAPPQE